MVFARDWHEFRLIRPFGHLHHATVHRHLDNGQCVVLPATVLIESNFTGQTFDFDLQKRRERNVMSKKEKSIQNESMDRRNNKLSARLCDSVNKTYFQFFFVENPIVCPLCSRRRNGSCRSVPLFNFEPNANKTQSRWEIEGTGRE